MNADTEEGELELLQKFSATALGENSFLPQMNYKQDRRAVFQGSDINWRECIAESRFEDEVKVDHEPLYNLFTDSLKLVATELAGHIKLLP